MVKSKLSSSNDAVYMSVHVSMLAQMLDSTLDPLGDGEQTLLDNTMILWVGELGDATHGFRIS